MFDDYIGRAGYKEIVKIGYDYPTDKSLSPRADTPVTVTVQNNFAIASVGVETAGKNYSTAPDLFLPDRPCLLYTSPSPRDRNVSRMPSSA